MQGQINFIAYLLCYHRDFVSLATNAPSSETFIDGNLLQDLVANVGTLVTILMTSVYETIGAHCKLLASSNIFFIMRR